MKKALIFLLTAALVFGASASAFAAGLDYAANVRIATDAIPAGASYLTKEKELCATDVSNNFYTYQGHVIRLLDSSIFNLGSQYDERSGRSVTEAINGGFTSNSWTKNPSQVVYENSVGACAIEYDVSYKDAGSDNITLRHTWLAGGSGTKSVSANIEVRTAPAIDSVVLGGTKRAGHPQTLTVAIAQDPAKPPQSVNIDIPGAVIGEASAKYTDRNEFIIVTVPFVTYNEETRDYTYYVDVTSESGSKIHSEGTFTVLKDESPKPVILMNEKFYRDAAGVALVSAKNIGPNPDDEVVIDWSVKSSSGKIISGEVGETGDANSQIFQIKTPGKYQMILTITDVTEMKKQTTVSKTFTVENTAPKISLGQSAKPETKKLGLVLLNYTGDTTSLNEALRDQNIIAQIAAPAVPGIGASETLKLVDSAGSTAALETLTGGAPNELGARLDGCFPVFDALGDVNYVIEIIDAKHFELRSLDGSFTYRRAVNTGSADLRQPFGLEMEHGTIYVVFPGLDDPKADREQFIVETVSGCSSLDAYQNLAVKAYTTSFKSGSAIIMGVYNKLKKVFTNYTYQFTPSFENAKTKLEAKYFSDENDVNLFIDCSSEEKTDQEIIEEALAACGASGGGQQETGSGTSTSTSGNFTFSYSDLDGDPFGKAFYEYNGKIVEVDSLTISVTPVAGANTLKYWVLDSCGAANYNKKSNIITIKLDAPNEDVQDTKPSIFKLHRLY